MNAHLVVSQPGASPIRPAVGAGALVAKAYVAVTSPERRELATPLTDAVCRSEVVLPAALAGGLIDRIVGASRIIAGVL